MTGAPLRLGLVGLGRWGRVLARTIARTPGLVLDAAASRAGDAAGALAAAGAADCAVVADWEALLDRGLDGLVVATPPAHHLAPVRAGLLAGLPVLVEKPLTLAPAQAAELAALARSTAVPCMVDHTQLFAPGFLALKEHANRLGRPRRIRLRAGAFGPFRPEVPVLWDWGAHEIALLLDLVPGRVRPRQVEVVSLPEIEGGMAQSVHAALLVAGDGGAVEASLSVSNVLGAKERSVSVELEAAGLRYAEYPAPVLSLSHPDGRTEALRFESTAPLDGVLESFAATVRSGEVGRSSAAFGARVVDLLAACEAAAGRGVDG